MTGLDPEFLRWMLLLLRGAAMTLAITLCSIVLGALLGAVLCAAKLSGYFALRSAANIYTTVFRGVPELLVIYVIYFGGSSAVTGVGRLLGYGGFLAMPAFIAGVCAVGVVSGAYQTEVFRGAYLAIAKGELEAAHAFGMTRMQMFFRIVLPQVVRLAIPGLGNVWQLTLKDSALVSVTGLAELMRMSQVAAGSTRAYFLYLAAGGALYLMLTSVSDQAFKAVERFGDRSMPSAALGQS